MLLSESAAAKQMMVELCELNVWEDREIQSESDTFTVYCNKYLYIYIVKAASYRKQRGAVS